MQAAQIRECSSASGMARWTPHSLSCTCDSQLRGQEQQLPAAGGRAVVNHDFELATPPVKLVPAMVPVSTVLCVLLLCSLARTDAFCPSIAPVRPGGHCSWAKGVASRLHPRLGDLAKCPMLPRGLRALGPGGEEGDEVVIGEGDDDEDVLGNLASRILEIEAAKGQRLRAPMLAEERDNEEEDASRGMGEMMMDGAYTINWDGHDATVVQNFRCTTREVRQRKFECGTLAQANTGRDAAA